ncbi:hypothetical protein OC846_005834 [Tilletia horrida]|uniref:Exosome complex component CSL4 C-terminal domain-containing protein n=1 Tax=Tilletia horrida TaxID=155126 RepID=A0AAN6GJS4_9BASI|nr:hypothetical protein OC845_005497 [Tilletia horrida]KAK0545007.1 hypothetical protein OC846_005834 [Tilletia horrida]KAK0560690.1 hypothetical protein OC861_006177 [Tilletia horrida]
MADRSVLLLPGQPVPPPSQQQATPSTLGAALLSAGPGTYTLGSHLLSSRVGYASYATPSSVTAAIGKAKAASRSQAPSLPISVSVGPSRSSTHGKRKRDEQTSDDVVRIPGQGGASAAQDAPDQGLIMPRQDSIVIGRITRVNARQATLSILVVDGQPCGISTHALSQTPAGQDQSRTTSSSALFTAATGEGNHAAGEEGSDFTGVIRAQDVRATEKDKVRLADCFRVGDIVRASVISLGDARSYFLSTAENRLGVIYAVSSSAPPIKNVSLANQGTSGGSLSSAADMLQPWAAHRTPEARAGTTEAEVPMEPVSWQEMRDVVTGLVEKRKCAKPDVL